jgi:hypothetical protein
MSKKILVPLSASNLNQIQTADLTVQDLKTFEIQKMMENDPNNPTFFVYYCTTGGDVLGKLIFTSNEVIFDPLNAKLKGVISYAEGNLVSNLQMGFILNYADIVGEPLKIPTPCLEELPHQEMMTEEEENNHTLNYHVQIEVCNTGQFTFGNQELKKEMISLKDSQHSIASFSLKVNN